MTTTFINTGTYVVETCCRCGIDFGIPEDFYVAVRDNSNKWFYCPNGHRQHYTVSRATKLQRQLDAAHNAERDLRNRLETTQRSRAALKGQVTKIKRRVGKGICPCCRRNFANLKHHMENQHPDWSEE